jgi:hypothetical protein
MDNIAIFVNSCSGQIVLRFNYKHFPFSGIISKLGYSGGYMPKLVIRLCTLDQGCKYKIVRTPPLSFTLNTGNMLSQVRGRELLLIKDDSDLPSYGPFFSFTKVTEECKHT